MWAYVKPFNNKRSSLGSQGNDYNVKNKCLAEALGSKKIWAGSILLGPIIYQIGLINAVQTKPNCLWLSSTFLSFKELQIRKLSCETFAICSRILMLNVSLAH